MSRRLSRGYCAPGAHVRFRLARGARLAIEHIRHRNRQFGRATPPLRAARCPHCGDFAVTNAARPAVPTAA